ncbi:hypothetical protein LXA43DRAFT_1080215 [Ganoderma leucocontextum]|nr:hypothetical protein LXA43DRAFT_1080215 [Ganoderma leucocontextum]
MSADDVGTRPPKRKLVSLDDSPLHTPSYTLNRHPEFWFDDGTIVLVLAQQTGFRIYRGLLASQSTIFADMLAASSSSSDEILDECPVVQLADSPQDLAHLLGVLLPTSPVHYHMSKADQPRSFDEVSAVIRLADKYHIESVLDHALRSLQRYHFTSNFDAFSGPPDTEISVEPIHAIGAVNLAHLTNTPRMLPLALYKCCYLDDDALLAGWKRADGTVEQLTPTDLKRCSDARMPLLALHASFHSRLFNQLSLSPECPQSLSCAWVSGWMADVLRSALPERMVGFDVFHGWAKQLAALTKTRGLCEACVRLLMRRNWVDRGRIWDALPEVFGVAVEGWKSPEAGDSTGE